MLAKFLLSLTLISLSALVGLVIAKLLALTIEIIGIYTVIPVVLILSIALTIWNTSVNQRTRGE